MNLGQKESNFKSDKTESGLITFVEIMHYIQRDPFLSNIGSGHRCLDFCHLSASQALWVCKAHGMPSV